MKPDARLLYMLMTVSVAGPGASVVAGAGRAPSDTTVVRVAYTSSIFRDVAEHDARAAIKVWSQATADERNIPATSRVDVLPDAKTLAESLRNGLVDLGGTTLPEFLGVEAQVDVDRFFAMERGGEHTVEYVVLVHRTSAATRLSDLRDATLNLYDNPRTSLAIPWVDLELAKESSGPTARFFARITPSTKLTAVVLPVFFRQADACVVTEDGFRTMAELNPQVGRDLRVIAKSPGVVPAIFFLRRDFRPVFRDDLIEAVGTLGETAAGRQILTLIQADGLVVLDRTALNDTRELYDRWRKGEAEGRTNRVLRSGLAAPAPGERR